MKRVLAIAGLLLGLVPAAQAQTTQSPASSQSQAQAVAIAFEQAVFVTCREAHALPVEVRQRIGYFLAEFSARFRGVTIPEDERGAQLAPRRRDVVEHHEAAVCQIARRERVDPAHLHAEPRVIADLQGPAHVKRLIGPRLRGLDDQDTHDIVRRVREWRISGIVWLAVTRKKELSAIASHITMNT